jgi:hypothetical protein
MTIVRVRRPLFVTARRGTLAGYVEDAIRERLERDRAELNGGEDFPPVTNHLRPDQRIGDRGSPAARPAPRPRATSPGSACEGRMPVTSSAPRCLPSADGR